MGFVDLYQKYLPELRKASSSGHEWKTLCPFHKDTRPSFYVNEVTGYFYCQGCGVGGGVLAFFDLLGIARPQISEFPSVPEDHLAIIGAVSPVVVEQMHRNLLNDERKLEYVLRKRLVSYFIVRKFLLGYDTSHERYAFPIRSRSGRFINIKLHHSHKEPKSFYLYSPAEIKLYPISAVFKLHIVICEGEWDCMALHSLGINAITSTGGAGKGKWNPQWNEFFRGKFVKVICDSDVPGQEMNEDIVRNLTGIANEIRAIKFPEKFVSEGRKVDVTDYLLAKLDIFKLLGFTKKR